MRVEKLLRLEIRLNFHCEHSFGFYNFFESGTLQRVDNTIFFFNYTKHVCKLLTETTDHVTLNGRQ